MCNGILPVLFLCVFSQMPVTARQSQAYINGCRHISTSSTKQAGKNWMQWPRSRAHRIPTTPFSMR